MEFTLTRGQIRAMLHLAATKDIRFYLNGLHIVQDGRGTIVEATDGHLLGCLRVSEAPMPPAKVILDRDSLKPLMGTKRQSDEVVEFYVDGDTVKASAMGMLATFKRVDGVFPDVSRVTPRAETLATTPDSPANFNPALLMRFCDCARELGTEGYIQLRQRGQDSALVSIGLDNFTGVVMPVRDDDKFLTPWWVHHASEKDAALEVEDSSMAA